MELPLLVAGIPPSTARRRALDALERVGLAGRGGDHALQLADGDQLRAAVARALVAQPDVVWVDDPTADLDSETAASVLDLVGDVHAAGSTVVVLTLDEAIGAAGTRLVRLADGHLTFHDDDDGVLVAP